MVIIEAHLKNFLILRNNLRFHTRIIHRILDCLWNNLSSYDKDLGEQVDLHDTISKTSNN